MYQPLLIVIAGAAIVTTAISVNVFLWQDEDETPRDVTQTATPKKPVQPTPQVGESVAVATKAVKPSSPEVIEKKQKLTPEKVKPTFDVVRVTTEGNAVIAGRADPGSTVAILADGQFIGQIQADSRGEWVLVPDKPLAPGSRQFSLEQRIEGQKSLLSDDVVVIVVPERRKDIAGRPTKKPSQALVLKFPRKGDGPSTLLQKPTPESAARRFAVDTIDYDDDGRLHISGRGEPLSTVQLYLDGKFIGRTVVDANSGWRIKPDNPVTPGIYQMRADHLNAGGKVVGRLSLPFARAEPMTAENMPPEPFVIVQPGNSLWRLARRAYGSGFNYTVIYQANKEQIGDPDMIFPGQVLAVPTTN
jgi:nucleoid-associated protein YgaU